MIPDDITAALTALQQQRPDARLEVCWHEALPSTMDAASLIAQGGASHGVVVVADEQTAGRGRRGTTWASPAGAGLYFSFIARSVAWSRVHATLHELSQTRTSVPGGNLSLITLAAGVAVRDGIASATGLAADLKWPNDVIVGRRKLAGILAEGLAIGAPEQAVVIGVGINVQPTSYPPDVAARATSLEGELGRPVDRGLVLARVLLQLWDRLALLEQRPGDILQAWRAASPTAAGTRVEWEGRHGVTAGIDETGALLVKTADRIERIISGDLMWDLHD